LKALQKDLTEFQRFDSKFTTNFFFIVFPLQARSSDCDWFSNFYGSKKLAKPFRISPMVYFPEPTNNYDARDNRSRHITPNFTKNSSHLKRSDDQDLRRETEKTVFRTEGTKAHFDPGQLTNIRGKFDLIDNEPALLDFRKKTNTKICIFLKIPAWLAMITNHLGNAAPIGKIFFPSQPQTCQYSTNSSSLVSRR
jgi:hypothetical protein